MLSLPLSLSAVAVLITFLFAAFQDWKTRTVSSAVWYPAAVIGGVCAVIFWAGYIHTPGAFFVLLVSLFVAVLCAVFSLLGMFGKADAKALVLLSLTVPVTPFAAWVFPSLAVSVIVNAGILSLFVPVVCLLYNLGKGNRAPFWLMCSGKPVPGSSAKNQFGFLAETVLESEGRVEKQFVKMRDVIFSLRQSPERNTRNLREHPKEYAKTLSLLETCDTIWVTTGIPLLVPLTAGLISALFGVSAVDILLTLLL